MPKFSQRSLDNLQELHPDLQRVLNRTIQFYDFTIICGHRGEAEQNKAYDEGKSKLRFPRSRHNTKPSQAVDCVPYPLDWNDHEEFMWMARAIKLAAHLEKVEIIWGGDWLTFHDLPHFALKERV